MKLNVLCFVAFVICVKITANQFDPHVFPTTGPFFEGWYLRIIDFDHKSSFGLLFGHVLSVSGINSNYPKVLASLLYRANCTSNEKCKLNSSLAVSNVTQLNVTSKHRPVVQNPDDRSPSQFEWKTSFGQFIQDQNITTYQFNFKDYIFRGRIGQPVPWGPNGEGPEGWIDKLPFIPLHWFVFSLRSPLICYELTNARTGKTVTGKNGVVHMEKNWGNSFPKGWIWSQGVSEHVSYALSGGLVSLAKITTKQYLFGYRNPSKGLSIDFRPGKDLTSTFHDGCKGVFNMTIQGLLYKVHLEALASPSTFSECLFGPEVTGFRPVCTESYDTTTKIIVYERNFFHLKEIDRQVIHSSALEFGGQYTCNNRCAV